MPNVIRGWPDAIPGASIAARDSGGILGALLLEPAGMAALAACAPVLSVRIDDHDPVETWEADRPDGSFGPVVLKVPTEPVEVPLPHLTDYYRFMEWSQSVHGFEGRLLLWDTGARWWVVHDPDLELALVCAAPDLLDRILGHGWMSDGDGWHEAGPIRADWSATVERLASQYGVPRPPLI